MTSSLRQHGFSIVETLLILVIIGLLGGSAYYVLNSKKNVNKSLDNASSQEQNVSTSSSATRGQFQSKDLGFKFEYPEEWGAAKTSSHEGEKGTAYSLTFANTDNYYATFLTKDYYQPPLDGRGGGCSGGADLFPDDKLAQELRETSEFYEIKVDESDLKVVFTGASYIAPESGCPLRVGGMKLLLGKAKISKIFFFYDKDDQFKDDSDIARYYENPVDFYSETEQNIFMGVMRSIKEI